LQIEVLINVALFRPLPMPALDNLALNVETVHPFAGEEVFRQGDRGDRFHVIEEGEAEVIGDGKLIRTLLPGDGFGEIAVLHSGHVTHGDRTRANPAPTLQVRPEPLPLRDSRLRVEQARGRHVGARSPRRRCTGKVSDYPVSGLKLACAASCQRFPFQTKTESRGAGPGV
jgi:CRP-like cAMP-binding protein